MHESNGPTYEVELAFFEESVGAWVTDNEGRYAVIQGRKLLGVYHTDTAAFEATAEKLGSRTPFLIKKITLTEKVVSIAPVTIRVLMDK